MRHARFAAQTATLCALIALLAGCTSDVRPGVHSAPPGTHFPVEVILPGPYRVGEEVHVLSDGAWHAGRVLEAGAGETAGQYRVHVDGRADSLDAWVMPDQLRLPSAGVTTRRRQS